MPRSAGTSPAWQTVPAHPRPRMSSWGLGTLPFLLTWHWRTLSSSSFRYRVGLEEPSGTSLPHCLHVSFQASSVLKKQKKSISLPLLNTVSLNFSPQEYYLICKCFRTLFEKYDMKMYFVYCNDPLMRAYFKGRLCSTVGFN